MTSALIGVLALAGCKSGTSGGPGAVAGGQQPVVGQADETFQLVMNDAALRQGESQSVSITIKRTVNFNEDVTLSFSELPQGLSIDDDSPVIGHGDSEARVTFSAAADASLGDFTLTVIGHPTKGSNASNKLNLSITKG